MKSFRDLIRIAFIACWTGYLGNASGDQDALHLKNDAQARFKHATALAQQGQDDEAIALFDALIAQYPELPEPYNNLAALHAKYGRLDAARAALESALAVHSDYALAYQNLGKVYLQLAERAYQRTLELEPRNASAKRMQQRIQSILAPSAKSLKGRGPRLTRTEPLGERRARCLFPDDINARRHIKFEHALRQRRIFFERA